MPTFAQADFIERAVESLRAQTWRDWELVIVDDGSRDRTANVIAPYLADPRITCLRNEINCGLGAALNRAMNAARGHCIAYLPSDDVYYSDHLATLAAALEDSRTVMAASGLRHSYNRSSPGRIPGSCWQLVQVMHRRSDTRWVERSVLTTDDLGRMYWDGLCAPEAVAETGLISCEWVDHPDQRHKIVREPVGGINPYRLRYGVTEPLVFHTTVGHRIDEVERYRRWRERDLPASPDGLKILLVGELAYNPERVLALAEAGHRLFGLWTDTPYWYNWIGPLPFGHVDDLPRDDWQAAVKRLRPDVIYALLNWQTIPFAHEVMTQNPGVPFVWHFKEGPFIALEKGTWPQLLDLYLRADGRIYGSDEMRDWFATVSPRCVEGAPVMVLDGDLPKRDFLLGERAPRLSQRDGEIHTVVPGRPIGLHPETVAALAAEGVHLHFYGEFTHGQWLAWIERARGLAGRFLHLHANVDQENWLAEFSQYDAGWLHFFRSTNHGDIARSNWDDQNIPARIATLAAAGLPMLQRANDGHIVAIQRICRDMNLGVSFDDMPALARALRDAPQMNAIRESVWARRAEFTFDFHVERLVDFFRKVMANSARDGR